MTQKLYWIGVNLVLVAVAAAVLAVALAIALGAPEAFIGARLRSLAGVTNGLALLTLLLMVVFRSYRGPGGWVWWPLAAALLATQIMAFLGYLLPWGQLSFWLASLGGAFSLALAASLGALVLFGLLAAHAAGLARAPERGGIGGRYRWWGVAILMAILAAILLREANEVARMQALMAGQLPPSSSVTTAPASPEAGAALGANPLRAPAALAANPLAAPAHIMPDWPNRPAYGALRAVPFKLGGILALAGFLLGWAALPVLDRAGPGAAWQKGRTGGAIAALIGVSAALGWAAGQPPGLLPPLLVAAHFLLLAVLVRVSRER